MTITPEQARVELAKRELARRGVSNDKPMVNASKIGERNLSPADFAPSEQRMMGRPSAIQDLVENPTTMQHPLGAALRTMGGAAELTEGIPASIGVDIQNRNFSKIPEHLYQVLVGKRPAQFGDIAAGAGAPEPLAAGIGLLASFGLGGVNPKSVAGKAGKNIGIAGKIEKGVMAAPKVISNAVMEGGAKIPNPLQNIFKFSKAENRMNLVNEVRDDFIRYKKDLSDIFGGEYEKIVTQSDTKIDLRKPIEEWFADHGSNVMNNEEFRQAFKTGDPTAKKIHSIISEVTNKNSKVDISNLSAQDADSFRKYIENLPGIRRF